MTDIHPVDLAFAAKSRIDKAAYERDYRASVEDPDAFWRQASDRLSGIASRRRSATSATTSRISASAGTATAS